MTTWQQSDSLVSTDWLAEHIDSPSVRVLDVRGHVRHIPQPDGTEQIVYEGARVAYDAGHIPGALFVDWTTDITDPNDQVPIQVAPVERLAALFGRLGLRPDDHIVIYDQGGASQSTRMWWVLTYAGHRRVSLLNGGFGAWVAEDRPVTQEVPAFVPTTYPVTLRPELRRTIDQTAAASRTGSARLIDARGHEYFRGEIIRSGRAGHIPSAVNVPAASLFAANGRLKPDHELKAALEAVGVDDETPVIAYCGGGVTATTVLFALQRTGHTNWSNYDGSWNEWGPRTDLPAESDPGVTPRGPG